MILHFAKKYGAQPDSMQGRECISAAIADYILAMQLIAFKKSQARVTAPPVSTSARKCTATTTIMRLELFFKFISADRVFKLISADRVLCPFFVSPTGFFAGFCV